jgi:hypothetical protein
MSGKMFLFQGEIPYFRQKYLNVNPRVVFKDAVTTLAYAFGTKV